jgi:hypothetical protein
MKADCNEEQGLTELPTATMKPVSRILLRNPASGADPE